MSKQSEGKKAKGRNYDQVTKDGGSAAGTLGAGGTGEVDGLDGLDGNRQAGQAGNGQGSGRTDDLLSAGAGNEQGEGFRPDGEAGGLQTGLDGIARSGSEQAGSRQSAGGSGNIGGVAGGQHKDWGHSPVATAGNAQSAPEDDAATRASARRRQGVMPGEEMGHLHPGKGGGKR